MIRRYSPFDEIDQFFGRMGRGFEQMAPDSVSHIAVDVADHDDEYVVTADLPGFDREEIDLTVDDTVVTLTATRQHEQDETGENGSYLHRERRSASVQRRISLPGAVEEENATATYRNGVLSVTLPKHSAVAIEDGRRIDIE